MVEATVSGGAPPPADPELLGVPLSAYAAVLAYTGEGVPLDRAVDHAGIAIDAWPAVEAAWSARLAESALGDGALIDACDAHRLAAQAHVERALPPVDQDLRAWLDFFRAFRAADDPLDFLEKRGLVEGDVFRLLALWNGRMAADREVALEASAILSTDPGPLPEVIPAPPALAPSTKRARRAIAAPNAPVIRPKSHLESTVPLFAGPLKPALPFAPGSAPVVLPPSPAAPPRASLGDTAPLQADPARPPLPFAGPAHDGGSPGKPGSAPIPPTPRLSLLDYARLHAEITADRAATAAILARFGLTADDKRDEDAAWKARFAAEPMLRVRWMKELTELGKRTRGA